MGTRQTRAVEKLVQKEDGPSRSRWGNSVEFREMLLLFFALGCCSPLCLLPICPAETECDPLKLVCLIGAKAQIKSQWCGRRYLVGGICFSASCLISRGKLVCPPADLSPFQKQHLLPSLPSFHRCRAPLCPSNASSIASGERASIQPRLRWDQAPVEAPPTARVKANA